MSGFDQSGAPALISVPASITDPASFGFAPCEGGVCAAEGIRAAGVHAGFRADPNRLDLALVAADAPCTCAATFTQNRFCAAPVQVSRKHASSGSARAVILNSGNANEYLDFLVELNGRFGETLYGMPIIEDRRVAFKETRLAELEGIKRALDAFRDLILNVRVGATDFSSCFGARRDINYTIYDIMTVRDILTDILNMFTRENDYTVSGPVWEYFRINKSLKFADHLPDVDIRESLLSRKPIVNDAVDGLMRELILDKANGFVGKTIIHPTHINYVNGMLAVTREEYEDALQVLNVSGGVVKSTSGNKMNEIKPHTNWARKVYNRARAFGVIKNESGFVKLFAVNE